MGGKFFGILSDKLICIARGKRESEKSRKKSGSINLWKYIPTGRMSGRDCCIHYNSKIVRKRECMLIINKFSLKTRCHNTFKSRISLSQFAWDQQRYNRPKPCQLKKSECLQYLLFSPTNVPLPSGRERLWQLFVVLGKSFGFLRVGGYWWVVVPNIGKLYHWSPHPKPALCP